ncbi:glucanase B, partial [Teratosphaeria nubilosa]
TASTLQVALQNQTTSSTVYAYITGQAINNNNAVVLIESDGKTPYYPPSPSSNGTAIGANVSIPLGAPGNTVTCTIPQIAGGRIWFSIGTPLQFFVNPGPGLVEPSVFNQSDPNYNTNFGFCEFTYNSSQLFINISYVDFVGPPIALTLQDSSGSTQHVSGMNASGPSTVASGLTAQTKKDGQPWSSLIVNNSSGGLLRILSPNSGIELNPTWFSAYWTSYVDQVYAKYATNPLTVDTQASYGNVSGSGNPLNFSAGGTFAKPSAADIFGNSTGPFATGSNAETNAIIPRLAAAFDRSTLLLSNNTPNGTTPSQYYTNATTNHYARILHATNLDGFGYTFPYDDVTPDGGVPQEGAVYSSAPSLLTVAVGGSNA